MPRKHFSFTLLLVLASLLPGCGIFDFTGQGIALSHDAEADALELELTYHGVQALEAVKYTHEGEAQQPREVSAAVDKAFEALEAMSQGERTFVIAFPRAVFALDREDPALETFSDHEKRTWEWTKGISLLECRIDHDEAGQLGVYQKLRFAKISKGVALLNEGWCLGMADLTSEDEFALNTPFLDDRTRELLCASVAEGRGPFALDEGALTLTFPITGATAAHLLAYMSKELATEDAEYWALLLEAVLAPVSELEISDEEVRLSYAPDDSGVLRFELPGMTRDYDPALADFLRESDLALPASFKAGE